MTSSALTMPLNVVDSRTPITLSDAQTGDQRENGAEVHPRMRLQLQYRDQLTEIVDARPREERDVDGEVEQYGPAGDEAENVAQPAHDEVLSAARDGIRGRQLRVGEADADVDDAGEEESDVRRPGGRAEDESQADENVGADVGITPRERAPRRDRTP